MGRKNIACIIVALGCLAAPVLLNPLPACANGYDVYASPLCWSPDGAYLAAAVGDAWPQDSVCVQGNLRLYDSHGGYTILATGEVGSPSFSADSQWLACINTGWLVAFEHQPDGTWVGGDYYNGALDCRFVSDAADVPRIAFTAGERFYGSSIMGLYPLAMDTIALVPAVPESSLFSTVPSPSGESFLALYQNSADDAVAYERIVRYDGATKQFVQLTKPEKREWDYHESNIVFVDEDTILFQRGGWGDWRLYRYELAEGQEYIELSDAQQASLSADGRFLAFTRRDPMLKAQAEYDWDVPPEVWLRDREKGVEKRISAEGVEASFPALRPDGAKVAWLELGYRGTPQVVIRSVPPLLAR